MICLSIKKRQMLMKLGIFALLGGCASTPTEFVTIDNINFKGDAEPLVTSKDAFQGNYSNLAANESLVIARASDGSGALSQPSSASIVVVEPELKNANSVDQFDLWLKRCDIDSDGVLDRHCPELFSAMKKGDQLSNNKFVSFESWYTINSNPKTDKDFWGTTQTLDTSKSKSKKMPVTLKLLTVNHGNKDFQGDLDIVVNIPTRVELGNISLASKVKSRKAAKEAIDVGMAVLGALAGSPMIYSGGAGDTFLDDYAAVDSNAKFRIVNSTNDRVFVKVENIDLKPEQGVTVEFSSLYEIID